MIELLSPQIKDALIKKQVGELQNSIHYKNMRAYFEKLNLNGFAKFFEIQEKGELKHARIIENYLADRQCNYYIETLDNPIETFSSIKEIIELYPKVEMQTTQQLNNIYKIAMDEADFITTTWLTAVTPFNDLPLLPEQIEEEKTAYDLQSYVYRILGDNPIETGIGINAIDARLLKNGGI